MYKSINIFTSESDFESARAVLPYISLNYIEETNVIKCVERPNYFYIESLEDNNVVSFGVNNTWLGEKKSNIFYSFNKTNWFSLSLIDSLTLSANQYVYFKSNGSNLQKGEYTGNPNSNTKKSLFKTTKKFNVGGNVKLLLHQNDDISSGGCQYLFYSLQVVDASNLVLPATTLADHCYNSMFSRCTSLTSAPELPATTLADGCYNSMFYDCTSLTTAPELPATTLADGCYYYMFYNCTTLTTAPELPATELAVSCYNFMFYNCTSLTTAPELPATELVVNCYISMFSRCTSLITAPALPATELAASCYNSMFDNCTSLITAPELPATTLAEGCYYDIFRNCTKLTHIKCLATDISAYKCTSNWVNGVSSTGTFIKHPDMTSWSTGVDGIPSGWEVKDYEG